MKRLCLLTILGLWVLASSSAADQLIICGEDRELLQSIQAMQTQLFVAEADKEIIAQGLESDFDEIRVASIKAILIHRLEELWGENRAKLGPVVGTSKKLTPIVDAVFASPQSDEKAIIELLPEDTIALLPLKSAPVKPRAKNGDLPLEDVLLDVSVSEIARLKDDVHKTKVRKRLQGFQLNTKQRDMLLDGHR